MSRKSSNSGCICMVAILAILAYVFHFIAQAVNFICLNWPYFASFAIFLIVSIIFWFSAGINHFIPFSYDKIVDACVRRQRTYFSEKYSYLDQLPQNFIPPVLASELSATGRWYDINVPLPTFPAYSKFLLKGKRSVWVILAIEKDGFIKKMWVEKVKSPGPEALSERVNIAVSTCEQIQGTAILRLHNRLKIDADYGAGTLASVMERSNSEKCQKIVCSKKITWQDFLCTSDSAVLINNVVCVPAEPTIVTPDMIIDEIGITPEMDHELQQRYDIAYDISEEEMASLSKRPMVVFCLFLLWILFLVIYKTQLS